MSSEQHDGMIAPIMGPTLAVINKIKADGIIEDYVIGGSVSIVYYSEPFYTEDLDLFCHLADPGLILTLEPIFKYLAELGYKTEGEKVIIEGVPVNFLVPDSELVEEAVRNAAEIDFSGVPTKIFRLEYAMAIKVKVNRAKDWTHLEVARNSADFDKQALMDILQRYEGLMARWRRHDDEI